MADQQITLFLASWQKRLLKDFLPKDYLKRLRIDKIDRMIIWNPKRQCLNSYKIAAVGIRWEDWLMYLTDEQMNIVRDKLGLRVPISSINVTAEALKSRMIRFA